MGFDTTVSGQEASNNKLHGLFSRNKDLDRQFNVLYTIGQGGFGAVALVCHRHVYTLVAMKMVAMTTNTFIYRLREEIRGSRYRKRAGCMRKRRRQYSGSPCQPPEAQQHPARVDAEGNVKLGDSGLATRCGAGPVLQGRCGNKSSNAPELLPREDYDGKKAGRSVITTRYHPFRGRTLEEIEKNVSKERYYIIAYIFKRLDNLFFQMLSVAPERRPHIEDVQQHAWSLYKREYNEIMRTYLLEQQELDPTTSVKVVNPGPAPPPSLVPPLTSGRHLKRRASEPTFGLFHTQS
ncbi:hypothetical protein U0070_022822 [Myodes glareolus]|uniref:non-specific serine/threonine protein kinase n=1 Tax=Myodes glareolus TaxID=447135 RepID=A0AAW0K8H7_MYOGA